MTWPRKASLMLSYHVQNPAEPVRIVQTVGEPAPELPVLQQ